MGGINPNILLIVIIIFILVITVIYWVFNIDQKFATYISMLTIIGTLVLIVAFFRDTENTRKQQAQATLKKYSQTDVSYWINIEQKFLSQTPILRRLYKQLYLSNTYLQQLPDPDITPEIVEKEIHMISMLLQIVDSVSYEVAHDSSDWQDPAHAAWLRVFQSWFASPLLLNQWHLTKHLYNSETETFVNKYVLPQETSTPTE